MCLNETYSVVCKGEHLSDSFLIQNDLKQRNDLSPLFINFALEYDIRNVQENQVELKFDGTHQLLAYADDVNLLGDNIDSVNKNTETLNDGSKEVGLQINVEKSEYILVFHHQNAGQNRDIKVANKSLENMSQVTYLVTTITSQNLIQEEAKRRLNSGNACYHSVQYLLSSRLLWRNVKIRIYTTIIFLVALYGCETWSLTLREGHRPSSFDNRVLKSTFGLERYEVRVQWKNVHNKEIHDLYSSPGIIRMMKSRRMRWAGHVAQMRNERKVNRLFVRKPEGKRPLGRPRYRKVDNIRMDFGEMGWGDVGWIGLAQDMNR
jgi:hypothetical protein